MINLFNIEFPNLKLFAIATSTLASLGILSISPASAALVEFDLQFFENDVQVGFGEFSYDDAQPLEETFFDIVEVPQLEITAEDGWFELTSFSARIGGVSWTLRRSFFSPTSWVPSNSNTPLAGISRERLTGFPRIERFWIFGDPRLLPTLEMFPDRTWSQVSGRPLSPIDGTWVAVERAQSVPEPTTTLLVSGLVLGGGAVVKKRR